MNTCSVRRQLAAFVILGALFLIACRPAEVETETPPDASGETILPAGDSLTGWEMSSQPESYGPENLWDFINGQAEFYLNYGFVRVDTAEYQSESASQSVIVEIYQMASTEEAFGIYAAERNPGDRQLEIGTGGYLGSNVLNFWQGRNYIKLTSFETGAANDEALTSLAQEIARQKPVGSGVPVVFSYFPEEGRIDGSERFFPRGFLGQSYLRRAYRVDCASSSGGTRQLFLARLDSPDEARTALAQYSDFMRSQGREVELVEGDSSTMVSESGMATVVFIHDEFLGGVLDATSLQDGRSAADGLSERLRKVQ